MLQLGIVRSDVCAHGQAADVPAQYGATHHGEHGQPAEQPQPDCGTPGATSCGVASCAVVLAAPDVVEVAALLAGHDTAVAPAVARLLSVVTAPEPPPPRA
jgi:hypothetical protein